MPSSRKPFPVPFSSLTARSNFTEDKKYKPVVPDKPAYDPKLMDRLYSGLPKDKQLAVDRRRRARQNPTE